MREHKTHTHTHRHQTHTHTDTHTHTHTQTHTHTHTHTHRHTDTTKPRKQHNSPHANKLRIKQTSEIKGRRVPPVVHQGCEARVACTPLEDVLSDTLLGFLWSRGVFQCRTDGTRACLQEVQQSSGAQRILTVLSMDQETIESPVR